MGAGGGQWGGGWRGGVVHLISTIFMTGNCVPRKEAPSHNGGSCYNGGISLTTTDGTADGG
jgi:hypothetical protein